MQNPWMLLKEQIKKELKKHEIGIELEEPEEYGDFALPCFSLSGKFKKSPTDIAAELAKKLKPKYFSVKAVGPYVNFYIKWEEFGQQLLNEINKSYGLKEGKKIAIIDFSSPNPAHPFHLGTLRSTVIGESLARILENQSYAVKRICYINDLGKQAATLLLGYKSVKEGPKGKPDVWLGNIYFDINKKIAENPELEKEVSDILKKCETNKAERDRARKIFDLALAGFKQNWKMLGIKFNDIVFESDFIKESYEIVKKLKENKLAFESEGALVLNLEKYGLPSTIILRKDGTGLYLTRDMPFAIWKEKFKPELNIYVDAEDQRLHFQQLFKTLELLGYKDFAKKCSHLCYGMVLLAGKKMSGRKGYFVLWDELFSEGLKKALQEIKARWPELKKPEKRAKKIALGAIAYFILKYSPEKSVNFVWDEALRFEGDTGPYLQYTYARAGSILKKAKTKSVKKFDVAQLKDEKEIALLKLLAHYPTILEKAAKDLRPHYIANYLHNLGDAFNSFYQSLSVLKAEPKLRAARLKLVEAVKTVLKSGLYLLDIETLETM